MFTLQAHSVSIFRSSFRVLPIVKVSWSNILGHSSWKLEFLFGLCWVHLPHGTGSCHLESEVAQRTCTLPSWTKFYQDRTSDFCFRLSQVGWGLQCHGLSHCLPCLENLLCLWNLALTWWLASSHSLMVYQLTDWPNSNQSHMNFLKSVLKQWHHQLHHCISYVNTN